MLTVRDLLKVTAKLCCPKCIVGQGERQGDSPRVSTLPTGGIMGHWMCSREEERGVDVEMSPGGPPAGRLESETLENDSDMSREARRGWV